MPSLRRAGEEVHRLQMHQSGIVASRDPCLVVQLVQFHQERLLLHQEGEVVRANLLVKFLQTTVVVNMMEYVVVHNGLGRWETMWIFDKIEK